MIYFIERLKFTKWVDMKMDYDKELGSIFMKIKRCIKSILIKSGGGEYNL